MEIERPTTSKKEELPIFAHKAEILSAVQSFDVVILSGDTGCGKSTQVPQYLLELGLGGSIAITQPRRISAVSLAERVSEEVGRGVGDLVGYEVRFEESYSDRTRVMFMTEGILLKRMISDPKLSRFSLIAVDEAHERSLNCDLLL